MGARLTRFLTWIFGPPEPAVGGDVGFEFGPKVDRGYGCGWERAHDPALRDEDIRRMRVDIESENLSPESFAELAKAARRSREGND